jgi:hypothetical protein
MMLYKTQPLHSRVLLFFFFASLKVKPKDAPRDLLLPYVFFLLLFPYHTQARIDGYYESVGTRVFMCFLTKLFLLHPLPRLKMLSFDYANGMGETYSTI